MFPIFSLACAKARLKDPKEVCPSVCKTCVERPDTLLEYWLTYMVVNFNYKIILLGSPKNGGDFGVNETFLGKWEISWISLRHSWMDSGRNYQVTVIGTCTVEVGVMHLSEQIKLHMKEMS